MSDYVRMTDVLTSYWESLPKTNNIPKEADIDDEQLKLIWNDCYLAHVIKGKPYKYDFLGKNLIEAYGEEYARKEVESLVYPSIDKVSDRFSEVISTRKTLDTSGEFINNSNMLIKYRQLLMPFGNNDGTITHILGGMRWRAF